MTLISIPEQLLRYRRDEAMPRFFFKVGKKVKKKKKTQ